MLRWLKILLITLLLCVTLAVGAIAWIITDTERLKPVLETFVTNATGRPLKINGQLYLSIERTLTVRAENVDWLNPAWSSQPIMLHLDEIQVSIDLSSIKDGPITITNGQANGGQLFFEWMDGKPMNWDMRDPNAPPATTAAQAIPLALLQAQLKDVKLTFIHPALPSPWVVDISEASETQSGDNGLGLVVAAKLNDTEFDLKGEIGPFPELIIAGEVSYSVSFQTANSNFKSRGAFDDLASLESPDIELQYSAPEIKEVLKTLKLAPMTSGPMEIDARLITEAATIDLNVQAIAGDYKADALLKTSSLKDLKDLTLRFSSSGTSAALLGEIAGIQGLPASPYEIDIVADRTQQGLHVSKLSAKTKGINIEGSGIARQLPELRNFDLQLELKASSLKVLGDIARIDSLPDLPVSLSAQATANDQPLDVATGTMQLGNTSASFKTGISRQPDFAESTLQASLNSTDAREIIRLYNLDLKTALPAQLAFDSTLKSNALEINSAKLNLLNNTINATGNVQFGPSVGLALNIAATGDNLNEFVNLAIPGPDNVSLASKPWQVTADVAYSANNLTVRTESAEVGDDKLSFDGTVRFGDPIPAIDAIVAARGASLAESLAFTGAEDIPAAPYSAKTRLELSTESIKLSDIDATLNKDKLQGSAVSAWPDQPRNIKFDVLISGKSLQKTLPHLGSYIPPDSNYRAGAKGEYSADTIRFDQVEAMLGQAKLSLNGSVELPPSLSAQQLAIKISGPRLSDIGAFESLSFRPVPFDVSATVTGQREDLAIRDFRATVDHSNLQGSITLDLRRDKPTIGATLTANLMDFDKLLAKVNESSAATKDEKDGVSDAGKSSTAPSTKQRAISDSPINFAALNEVNAEFSLTVKELIFLDRKIRNFGFSGKLLDGLLDAPTIRGDMEYGNLDANVQIDAHQTPTKVKAKASATNVIFSDADIFGDDIAKLPRHGIVTQLEGRGDSLSALAGSATGYFWLTGGNGVIPTGKLQLLLGDLLTQIIETVNPFAKKDKYAPVACDAMYLEAKDGIIETAPAMILQTDRLSIVAAGEVDLKTEKINIGFRTTPLKGIGISASDVLNPLVKLGGTLDKPALVLDPTRTAIYGSAAFMTMGASLFATSMWNRWITSKDACTRMGKEATKIRQKIDPDNVPVLAPAGLDETQ
jgi:uncharacterized protein involved in outer membrane biogenesis